MDEIGHEATRFVAAIDDAPIVGSDREIVGEEIRRRESEIDDPRNTVIDEEHVVAEEVAVDRAFGHRCLAEAGLELELRGEEVVLAGIQKRSNRARGLSPPARTATIGEPRTISRRRNMQPAECRADGHAMRNIGRRDRCAVDAAHETRGLAVQQTEQCPGSIRDRRRTLDAGAREMGHQVQVERQLLGGQPLEERQHPATPGRRDEIIGVLDPGRNRRLLDERPDRVACKPGVEFFGGNECVDRHRAMPRAQARRRKRLADGKKVRPGERQLTTTKAPTSVP